MTTFPNPDRSQSCEEVLTGVIAILTALHEHLGGDRESRVAFTYAVAKAILEITDMPGKRSRMEANIVAHLVADHVTSRAHAERAEARAAEEKERERRKIVRLSERTKIINEGFRRGYGGGRGPDDAA